jgi:putative phosphonate metabolism protein
MSEFMRYAIYYVPRMQSLAAAGAAWLGWDVSAGCTVAQPDVPGIAALTQAPRKYGLHATLKPPFALADGTRVDDLDAALAQFAKAQAPVSLEGLQLDRLGRFLALVPVGDQTHLTALAANCVQNFDMFRAPASEAEVARRRAAGLTPAQDAHLKRWGYPYVIDQFRFHITLTGSLRDDQLRLAQDYLKQALPALPAPFLIDQIALVGQQADGFFRLIHSYSLAG